MRLGRRNVARQAWLSLGLVLVLGLALPLQVASAAWTTHQGDAQHSGYLATPPETVDLLGSMDLVGDEHDMVVYKNVIVETPHGLFGVLLDREDESCSLAQVDLDALEVQAITPVDACEAGDVGAYLEDHGLLILCSQNSSDEVVVSAVELPTGRTVWSRTPGELLVQADGQSGLTLCTSSVLSATGDQLAVHLWTSQASASGRSASSQQAVVALGPADGRVLWRKALPATGAVAGCGATIAGQDIDPACDAIQPYGAIGGHLVATTTGLVVPYYAPCSTCGPSSYQGAAAWLTWEGELQGSLVAEDLHPPGSTPLYWGPNWATASGPLAALPLGGHIVMVNPREARPVSQAPLSTVDVATGFFGIPGPAWHRDTLVVPLSASVTALDPGDMSRSSWAWTPGLEWALEGSLDIYGTLITGSRDVVVLAADEQDAGQANHRVYQLSQATGEPLSWVQLPPGDQELLDLGSIGAVSDGRILVLAEPGILFVLGPGDPEDAPDARLSSSTPAVGEPMQVTISPPPGEAPEAYRIAWGDGTFDEASPDQPVRHAYEDDGPHTLRLTAIYPDGRTATSQRAVDVGGQDLNPLQTAFARENQDVTFGILGLAVAVVGGVVGLARTRRKRGRLQQELEALKATFEATRHQPVACEAALGDARTRARALLLDGKLDEGQAAVLRDRVEELHRQLRITTLDERFQFLPHGMVLALQDMLADGRITAWEREHVHQVLDEDPSLTEEQKARLSTQVDAWFERDRAR